MEKKYNIMKVIMIVLVIILVGLIAFLFYDQLYDNKESQKESNIKNNSSNNNVVDNKKIIYDADYKYDVDVTSYSTSYNTYYIEDIKVPYIDIDSNDVKKINNEIKNIFNDAVNSYKQGIIDKMTYVDECQYTYFIDDNILSVIITYGIGGTDVVYPKYYTYNIDLKTGNLLNYRDVYTYLGLSDIDNLAKQAITRVMTQKLNGINNFDDYNNKSIANYTGSLNNNTLKYFIDKNKKLNIIVTLIIPAGKGSLDEIITL